MTELKSTSSQFRASLSFVHNSSRQHIIGLCGTPAVRQAVLRLAWYIRLIRFEIRFERKKNDSQVPSLYCSHQPLLYACFKSSCLSLYGFINVSHIVY